MAGRPIIARNDKIGKRHPKMNHLIPPRFFEEAITAVKMASTNHPKKLKIIDILTYFVRAG
jgi:hypothetical protein